jgi:anaerobic magnesium-protoporphyrin IX monomethyl ester cyclase
LYSLAVKEDWPLPENWSGYSQHSYHTLPLPTKYLSGAEVLRFRDHAFDVYFTNSRYLGMIADKFGLETARDLKQMTDYQLERKYLGTPSGVR